MAIRDTLARLAEEWATARSAIHRGERTEFRFECSVEPGPALGDAGVAMPTSLAEFWNATAGARLFEDKRYGQWGLVLLSPQDARARTRAFADERRRDALFGDLVAGEFLGDQDLLFIRCDPASEDFGRVQVAMPLDSRDDWYDAAPDLGTFLEQYERAQGAKYWEET
jgi:hypothetical protein